MNSPFSLDLLRTLSPIPGMQADQFEFTSFGRSAFCAKSPSSFSPLTPFHQTPALPKNSVLKLEFPCTETPQQLRYSLVSLELTMEKEKPPQEIEEIPIKRETPPRISCNCLRSKCLKRYCECLAMGEFCQDCNCEGCLNTLEHKDIRDLSLIHI